MGRPRESPESPVEGRRANTPTLPILGRMLRDMWLQPTPQTVLALRYKNSGDSNPKCDLVWLLSMRTLNTHQKRAEHPTCLLRSTHNLPTELQL